jgi:hypothetical protein
LKKKGKKHNEETTGEGKREEKRKGKKGTA